jgi:hypothetical protein
MQSDAKTPHLHPSGAEYFAAELNPTLSNPPNQTRRPVSGEANDKRNISPWCILTIPLWCIFGLILFAKHARHSLSDRFE